MATSILFLLIALFLSTSNPAKYPNQLSHLQAEVDSAILLNNQGVDVFYSQDMPLLDSLIKAGPSALTNTVVPIWARGLFRNALKKRPFYTTASTNLGNSTYNRLIQNYNGILQSDLWDRQTLKNFIPNFKTATKEDAFRLDAWHALGLIHYYTRQAPTVNNDVLDFAYIYYDSLAATNYFDTLRLYPNLETFLNLRSRIRSVQTNWQINNELDLLIDYTSNADDAPLELRAMLVDENRTLLRGTIAMRKSISGNGARIDQITLPAEKTRRASIGDSILVWIYNTEEKLPTAEYMLPFLPQESTPRSSEAEQTILQSGLVANQEYCVAKVLDAGLALRNRILNRKELDLINARSTTTEGRKLSDETYIRILRPQDTLTLLAEHPLQYEIKFRGNQGFIVKSFGSIPTIGDCIEEADVVVSNTLSMSGRILEIGSNQPLADVDVILLPRTLGVSHPRDQLRAKTDSKGSFEIAGLHSDARYELRLAKDGYGISGTPSIRSGSDWNAKPVEERMKRLSPYFEVRGTVFDAETGIPISGALLTIGGDGFSKGTNSDKNGQFQASIPDADVNTRSLSIVIAKRGYKDNNSRIANYTSGSVLKLNITPSNPRLLLDITRYPDADGPPRDSLLTDYNNAKKLLEEHRSTLNEQGRLGGFLAHKALLEFALEDYSAAQTTATEALGIFSKDEVTNHRDIPILKAMPSLIKLKEIKKDIAALLYEYVTGSGNSHTIGKIWSAFQLPLENHNSSLENITSTRNQYSTNREANIYLLEAQLDEVSTILEYIQRIQKSILSEPDKEQLMQQFELEFKTIRNVYSGLYNDYEKDLNRYSTLLKGR